MRKPLTGRQFCARRTSCAKLRSTPKGQPEIEAREHLLIGRCDGAVGDWPGVRDNSADQSASGADILQIRYPSRIEKPSHHLQIVFESSRKGLIGRSVQVACQFKATEQPDQVGDMQPELTDEEGILFERLDWFAFVDRVLNRNMGVVGASCSHVLWRRDCDALHGDFAVLGRDADPSGLRPHARAPSRTNHDRECLRLRPP